jgi:hypothetical protein
MGGGTRLVTGLVPVNGSAHMVKQNGVKAGKTGLCDKGMEAV